MRWNCWCFQDKINYSTSLHRWLLLAQSRSVKHSTPTQSGHHYKVWNCRMWSGSFWLNVRLHTAHICNVICMYFFLLTYLLFLLSQNAALDICYAIMRTLTIFSIHYETVMVQISLWWAAKVYLIDGKHWSSCFAVILHVVTFFHGLPVSFPAFVPLVLFIRFSQGCATFVLAVSLLKRTL